MIIVPIVLLRGKLSEKKYIANSTADFRFECSFCDKSMRLGEHRQFDTLKNIGYRPIPKNAPKCYF